jgi:hypothetical protein
MKTLHIVALTLIVVGVALSGHSHNSALAAGEYGTLYIDVNNTDGASTATTFGGVETVDVCIGNLSVGASFDIDIIIDDANDLTGPYWILYYDNTVLQVTAYNWTSWKLGTGGLDLNDPVPDSDGVFECTYGQISGVSGDGVLLRVTLQAIADGSSDLTLCTITGDCPNAADSGGVDHFYPDVDVDDPLGDVRVVVGDTCPPSPTPTPTPTPTATATPPAVSEMYNCPEAGKWSIATWGGQDATPIGDALALCSQQVDAAYRINPDTQAWSRYFRGRPEISNLATLDHGQGVFALGSGVSAALAVDDEALHAAANGMLGCPRAGKWAISVWTGASGTPADQAVASCTEATVAAAYWIDPQTQAWKRYFDGRLEISNLTSLDQMQGVFTLGGEPAQAMSPS